MSRGFSGFGLKGRGRGRGGGSAVASVFATALEEEVGAAAAPVAAPAAAPLPPSAATAAASARTPARDAGAYRFGRRYTRGVREPIAPSDVRRLRSIDAYEREGELGSGAMARVFRARERATGVAVALKAFRSNQPCAASAEEADGELGGVPLEVLRECALLRSLRHPNIVSAHEVLTHAHAPAAPDAATAGSPAAPAPRALFLAMEAVDFDLGLLIEHMAVPFSEGQAKCLCQQLLCALAALEEQRIAHRDLKQTNLLIDKRGVLRLADFGLARRLPRSHEPLTPDTTSLWYRAPEVLLGGNRCDLTRGSAGALTPDAPGHRGHGGYGLAIDVWAFGVLACEWLRKGEALLPGQSESDQLSRILALLGAPTPASWPAFFDGLSFPRAHALRLPPELTCDALDAETGETVRVPRSQLRKRLPLRGYDPAVPSTAQLPTTGLSAAGFEIVSRCLQLDPRSRPAASEALRHRWFAEPPLAEPLTRFELRALARARATAVATGAHALSIAQQAQNAAASAAARGAWCACAPPHLTTGAWPG